MIWTPDDVALVRGCRTAAFVEQEVLNKAYDPPGIIQAAAREAQRQFLTDVWQARRVLCEVDHLIVETFDDAASLQTKIVIRWSPGIRNSEFIGGPWHGRTGEPRDPHGAGDRIIVATVLDPATYDSTPGSPITTEQYVYEFYGWNPKTQHWVYTNGRKTS